MTIVDKILGALHFTFLNRKSSPSTKQIIKKTRVNGDVVGRDKVTLTTSAPDNLLSNEEKMVLKYLDSLRIQSLPPRDKQKTMLSELKIRDCSTLNDSKYIKIEGDDFGMKPDGMRYIDNLSESEKAKIILPEERKHLAEMFEKQKLKMDENKRNQWRNSAK